MGYPLGRPRTFTPKHCAAIAAATKGKPKSEAHKLALSAALKGRQMPDQHREAIRASHLARQARLAQIREEEQATELVPRDLASNQLEDASSLIRL